MIRALRIAAFVAALAFLALTFVNANWLAAAPPGRVKLVAIRGVHQIGSGPCTAAAIESPLHDYLENTTSAVDQAGHLGAHMATLDLQVTRDGHLVLYRDPDLSCRTNGSGPVGAHDLAEIAKLDAGYGYTADGGKTFPFRGRGQGMIPPLEEVLTRMPDRAMLFDLPADPRAGPQLVEILKALGRDPVKVGDGFRGLAADLAPIRQAWPKAWLWDRTRAAECTSAYSLQGWLGLTPAACAGQTLVVPGDKAWSFAGWPSRTQARMDAVGARVVMTASGDKGLTLPEQIPSIPASYTGYVMVEDIWTVGPALRPDFNRRTPLEEQELEKALDARRAKGE